MNNDCYIINRMYAGDYISDNNIGHEIINLFSDDNGDNYIYVNSDGLINPEYNGKVKGVILVRKTDSIHRLEVLGVAKVDEESQISYKSKKLTRPERLAEQNKIMDEYLAKHTITYGGISQSDLFAKNKFRGNYENYHVITFKAKELLLPYLEEDKKIYISDRKNEELSDCHLEDVTFPNQSLKQYISKDKFPKAFNEIERFIANDRELLATFCKEVLGIDNISDAATIEREKSADGPRIDIYIEDENNAVVIENKIKSEVNGTEERHNFTGDLTKSQLEDYYNYVEKNAGNRAKKILHTDAKLSSYRSSKI